MKAVSVLEHFSDHGSIHQKMKKNTTSVRSYPNSAGDESSICWRNVDRSKDQINTETIYLVHAKVNAVFGREWLRNFQLDRSSIKAVRVENCNSRTNKLNILLQKYEKIFSPGIGKLEKFCHRLQMKPNYKPVFFKSRPVPFALKERIETELNRLVAEDIIEPVTYSDWATPVVPVIKQNGNLRICGDYKVLSTRD
ncbi:uncharacterized protein K02A2.6 [Trichonephila clavipes]|nr:uncharacterized protein K02A2.6 [Trichonephila clavipes]